MRQKEIKAAFKNMLLWSLTTHFAGFCHLPISLTPSTIKDILKIQHMQYSLREVMIKG